MELALQLNKDLITLLLSNEKIKDHFFTEVNEILVFDKEKFMKFIDNKDFLPDSYTIFKNKIGLTSGKRYISENREVVLSWPYKDCILEGGQEKSDEKRKEIFHNEVLAPDEIDNLLEPKVLTSFKRVDSKGEYKITEIKPTDNLLIKGNNLLALHSLKQRFTDKIKLAYIDPPYNTGSDEFNYNDNFNHSTWLTFMKNRLEIARELLSCEGAIFVQIDHHEVSYLNTLMDEVFGRENFVQLITIKTASPAGFKTVNPGPIDVTEFLLFYTKDRKSFNFKRGHVPVEYDENYNLIIENIEDDPIRWKLRPLRQLVYEESGIEIGKNPLESARNAKKAWGKHWKIIRRQIMADYALKHRDRVVSIRDPHKPSEKLEIILAKSKKTRDKIFTYSKENGSMGYIINGGSLSFYSDKVKKVNGKIAPTELLTDLWTDISWDGIANEGGVTLKRGKKPEKLLKRIIELGTEKGDIVLDFFLGTGTTCAVAHKMDRQYIGIEQLDYGENSAVIRLKNVVGKDLSGISKVVGWKGGGDFVYCELKELNEEFIQKITKAKDTKELLKIWQLMKEKAFLSYKINPEDVDSNITEFEDLSIENQKKFLIECLDKNELYVNYSEIEDKQYNVSEADIELNKKFYKGS